MIEPVLRKRQLRRQILAARGHLGPTELRDLGERLHRRLRELIAEERPDVVAAYLPTGAEPFSHMTVSLPAALRAEGCRQVLLPVWNIDDTLSWGRYERDEDLVLGRGGLLEPHGPALPGSELERAELVIVPALAVDRRGYRLGRGAGCYDRALRNARADIVAAVYDTELIPRLPIEVHDVVVSAAIAPSGIQRMQ
ncbi:MAG TPA: 5-formyltetrahydrofolate cyclo-ligase [Mycobacteriales bacterium]|jgi:5-formyltetrahydrofolate cyclo-ligase|nr:5-formyltetrahydrofolate cyclo-ligase [Mycobacteriales bacterium]